MILGSPYNKLISVDGKSLSATQAAQENQKMTAEVRRREHESAQVREKRIAAYRRERVQDHALLMEMTKGFEFALTGTETINGRRCYVLKATPKSGYKPPSRETEVLTGMRGRMWIDSQAYQWVRVEAEVFRPVKFGLFLARVNPGTKFVLEQQPVDGNLWLPSHLSMAVNARVLVLPRNSTEEETYSNYHRSRDTSGTHKVGGPPLGTNTASAPESTLQGILNPGMSQITDETTCWPLRKSGRPQEPHAFALPCTDVGRGSARPLNLFQHPQHVPILPTFNHSAVANPNDRNSGHANCFVSCGHAQRISGVFTTARPTDTLAVTLRKRVVNGHLELRKGRVQAVKKFIETLRAYGVSIALMKNGVWREHFNDCCSPSFVPHLLEPASSQTSIQVSHIRPPIVV